MATLKLIAGLGNPGKEYAGTRHNVGFEVVDGLAAKVGTAVEQKKFSSLFGEAMVDDCKVLLLKPQTFMNLSGSAVATAVGFYKIPLSDVMIVTDDLALPPGMIRIRPSGSAGGHNGLKDIISRFGSDQVARLRVGIGSSIYPDTRDYVLGRPGADELPQIQTAVRKAQDALLCWIRSGLAPAMNRYNEKSTMDKPNGSQ
jgi:PTH1 family peptidyl-tRNA hydrolase